MTNWDNYFFKIAKVVASNSKCLSRQVGAVLTMSRTIISTGYNGPPVGVPHCGVERCTRDMDLLNAIESLPGKSTICPRKLLGFDSGEGLHLCPATHAEANCIAQAAWHGISTFGTTMYVTCGIPCKNCLALAINAGISEIVCYESGVYDQLTNYILNNSSLLVSHRSEHEK